MSPEYNKFQLGEWLEYIQEQHWRTMDLTLDRITEVWEILGEPKAEFTIAIAGTNGKGSCVSMLDAIYQQAGKKTGAYTSPHLVRFNERIKISGIESSDKEICKAFVQIEEGRGDIPLTYFEYATLCALVIFSARDVEIAILEVGMGGRQDAVNMLDNDQALITSIGLDHEQWLGSDREIIATEKAGIIKENGLVVCSESDLPKSVRGIADTKNATLIKINKDYFVESDERGVFWRSDHPSIPESWRNITDLVIPFPGEHQISNLGGVIASLSLTSAKTGVVVEDLQAGLDRAVLTGRCQVVQSANSYQPEIIVDVAHNEDSARELWRFLSDRPCNGNTYAVLGVLGDKAMDLIVQPISELVDRWILASLSGERGQTATELGENLSASVRDADWEACENPIEAFLTAKNLAKPGDRIVIFGSFYTVGDIIGFLESATSTTYTF